MAKSNAGVEIPVGRVIAPSDPAFEQLLSDTVVVWGTCLDVEQWPEGDRLRIQVCYGDEMIEYTDPLLENRVVSPVGAASALWAITSVCWKYRTPKDFYAFFENPASKEEPGTGAGGIDFEEWLRIGHECLRIFGNDFGNNQKLREQTYANV